MVVGTTEAARILKISTARLRVLLSAGRVEGAYKTGKMWLIPLFKGKPMIERGTRGPAPRWRNPKKLATTIIHVNSQRIRQNQKQQQQLPVITVKRRNTNTYGHIVEIPGGCRVVYSPDKPLSCGARVWIETLHEVKVICKSKSLDLPTLL
ncbi:DNA-binding protein [Capilliphycus salinus ALCB114379]|uniref:DNA-binding protein n=1 Tax=Capilliphycus salinus TaxID=2768948 RepID=UPI0039A5EEAE